MPTLATTYTGADWDAVRVQLVYAVDALNGNIKDRAGVFPKLTNAQALAIGQAWKKMGKAWGIAPPASHWPELWYLALGRWKEGDRFDMTTKHGASPAPIEVIVGMWSLVDYYARELDAKHAQPIVLVLNLSFAGYEAAARDAYAVLKKEKKRKVKLPLPGTPEVDLPEAPNIPLPVVPSLPTPDRGTGLLVLLIIIAIAVRRRK